MNYDYKDKETLEQLYQQDGLSTRQIGVILNCDHKTVLRWLHKHKIPRRPSGGQRIERASYRTNQEGYEQWTDDGKTVYVHQLVAIAHGADPHDIFSSGDYQVHHRDTIPFDNRHENLSVVSDSEHKQIHSDNEWVFDARLSCHVLDNAKRYGRTKRDKVRGKYANPDWLLAI